MTIEGAFDSPMVGQGPLGVVFLVIMFGAWFILSGESASRSFSCQGATAAMLADIASPLRIITLAQLNKLIDDQQLLY